MLKKLSLLSSITCIWFATLGNSLVLVFSYKALFLFFIFLFIFYWFSSIEVNCWISFTFTNCYWCLYSLIWMYKSTISTIMMRTADIKIDKRELYNNTKAARDKLINIWLSNHKWGCSLVAFLILYSISIKITSTPAATGRR